MGWLEERKKGEREKGRNRREKRRGRIWREEGERKLMVVPAG